MKVIEKININGVIVSPLNEKGENLLQEYKDIAREYDEYSKWANWEPLGHNTLNGLYAKMAKLRNQILADNKNFVVC